MISPLSAASSGRMNCQGAVSFQNAYFQSSIVYRPHYYVFRIKQLKSFETELNLQVSLEDEDGSFEICSSSLSSFFRNGRGISFQAILGESLRRCAEKRLGSIRDWLLASLKPSLSADVRSVKRRKMQNLLIGNLGGWILSTFAIRMCDLSCQYRLEGWQNGTGCNGPHHVLRCR